MTAQISEYDEVYGLLVQLCEQRLTLTTSATLCVMEAFNGLAEIYVPGQLLSTNHQSAVGILCRTLEILDGLLGRSRQLVETLQLAEVRRLISEALDAQR